MNEMILYFIGLQFINIVLATLKTVLTVKGTKWVASITNAIAYTVGIVIVWFVSGIPLIWSAPITFVLNIVGVYLGLTIIEKIKHNQLWRISTTVKTEYVKEYIKELKELKIQNMSFLTAREDYQVVDIFSKSKEETNMIKPILKKYDARYTVLTSEINLG